MRHMVNERIDQFRVVTERTVRILELKLVWYWQIGSETRAFDLTLTDSDNGGALVRRVLMNREEMRSLAEPFLNEIRRGYINDLFCLTTRYFVVINNIICRKIVVEPERDDQMVKEGMNRLNRYFTRDDKRFLRFFTLLRNSVIHHDGNHNLTNPLDFVYRGHHFETTDVNVGSQIQLSLAELFAFREDLVRILSGLPKHPRYLSDCAA